jgi:hypothetical protein
MPSIQTVAVGIRLFAIWLEASAERCAVCGFAGEPSTLDIERQ